MSSSPVDVEVAAPPEAVPATVSRTYSLRLRPVAGEPPIAPALWTTHVAVNRGACAFGSWLLRLRGGLDHRFADEVDDAPVRSLYRRLLALGWLSVESSVGAPPDHLVAVDRDDAGRCNWRTMEALAEILGRRGVEGPALDDWLADCRPAVTAVIRDDAVWVDRSADFDAMVRGVDAAVARADAWRAISSIYGASYLPASKADGEMEAASGAGAGQRTRHMYSHLFGRSESYGKPAVSLELRSFWREHLEGELAVTGIPLRWEPEDMRERKANGEVSPVEFPRLMIALAASALAKTVSKISSQEAARGAMSRAGQALDAIERDERFLPALAALDAYAAERGRSLGALHTYRILPRQTTAWADVVAAWSGITATDTTLATELRREVARAAQSRSEQKFGDIALFEELAAERYQPLWRDADTGEVLADIIPAYAAGQSARRQAEQLKAVAYRHPNATGSPLFVRYGTAKPPIVFSRLKAGEDARQVRLTVWDGTCARTMTARFVSARFDREIGRKPASPSGDLPVLSRVTRAGRAAEGVDADAAVTVGGIFGAKQVRKRQVEGAPPSEPATRDPEWAAQLIGNRRDLMAIEADLERNPERAQQRIGALVWHLQVPLALEPRGPFLAYARKAGLKLDQRSGELQPAPRDAGKPWRGLAWPFWHPDNEGRKGRAKLALARMAGLRVLSVKLAGSPFAAAVALWEAVSAEDAASAARQAGTAEPTPDTLSFVAGVPFRRIGPDTLPDGRKHPAPWARLERQIPIRIQGEEGTREASPREMWMTHEMERRLGVRVPLIDRLVAGGWGATPAQEARLGELRKLGWAPVAGIGQRQRSRQAWLSIDELQRSTLRTARLALERQKLRAAIAWGLTATERLLPGRRRQPLDAEGRIEHLLDTLVTWRTLATGTKYGDEFATESWETHVAPLLAGRDPEGGTVTGARKAREALRPAAEILAARDLEDLAATWSSRWQEIASEWRVVLGTLREWLVPTAAPEVTASLFNVGGCSLARIARMSELASLIKAVHGAGRPSDPEAVAASAGRAAPWNDLGAKILETADNLRDNRVRQIAGRIISSALGLDARGRRLYAPAHAVVVEDLGNLSPQETRARRSNRALAERSNAAIRDRIAEGCQLHGLHLRAIAPDYSNRMSSLTGHPGLLCRETGVAAVIASATNPDAQRRRRSSLAPAFERAVLAAHFDAQRRTWRDADGVWVLGEDGSWTPPATLSGKRNPAVPRAVYVPDPAGKRFISAGGQRIENLCGPRNAAANLGFAALLDPDWPGAWSRVTVEAATGKPIRDSIAGCPVLDPDTALCPPSGNGAKRGRRKSATRKAVSLWRDVSTRPVVDGPWEELSVYWQRVEQRAMEALVRLVVSKGA